MSQLGASRFRNGRARWAVPVNLGSCQTKRRTLADFRVVIDLTTESEVLQKLPGSMCPGIRMAMKTPAEVLYAMNVGVDGCLGEVSTLQLLNHELT